MSDYNRLVVFDCDGTLVDGQHLIIEAMHRTFDAEKLERVSERDVRGIIGLSLVEAMAKLLPDADFDYHVHMAEAYKTSFIAMREESGDPIEPLYAGIREVIDALDVQGYLLGVATGKSMRGLVRVLEHHTLKDRFVTLQTADGHPSKPDPSMIYLAMAEAGAVAETTVMIGDTTFDMTMAKAANVPAVGVLWGYHDHADLLASGADILLEETHELLGAIPKLMNE